MKSPINFYMMLSKRQNLTLSHGEFFLQPFVLSAKHRNQSFARSRPAPRFH